MKKKIAVILCLSLAAMSGAGCSFTGGEKNEKVVITVTEGTGEVFPYYQHIKSYLKAPAGADVERYKEFSTENQALGIVLAWNCEAENVQKFLLRYGKKGCNEREMTEVALDGATTTYELFNLYKSTEYEWSVTAVMKNGEKGTAKESFTTTDLGPRALKIDGAVNTRDVGGYQTESGKTTLQGLMIRGGELVETLSEEGQRCLSETLGIKVELDLRGYGEESGYRQASPIASARIEYVATDGYAGAFRITENFRQVFSLMADKKNYPMYVHCTGGADRTGTVIFLLNALLGVSETELIQDYEFTTFSRYGARNTAADTTYGTMFQEFLTQLKAYEGETLSQKTENYMLSIGVTESEIANIRAIMFGE